MTAEAAVNWGAYARVYDLMAENNPAYQALVRQFRAQVQSWSIPPGATLVELGAGTGNFSLELARILPHCQVVHVDGNPEMNRTAQHKAASHGLTNVTFQTAEASALNFADGSLAGLVAMHALYCFAEPQTLIKRAFHWLRPSGVFYACDPGQPADVLDWSRYIFRETWRRRGLLQTLRLFYDGRAVVRENRRIADAQRTGQYWQHSLESYCQSFRDAGFTIQSAERVYRDVSDLVIARKP